MEKMEKIQAYHITTERALEAIQEEGLKGSEWEEDFSSSCSDPFKLYDDGAVFCFSSLEDVQKNLYLFPDEYCVLLHLDGEGVRVDHESEGEIVVLRADTCIIEEICFIEEIQEK